MDHRSSKSPDPSGVVYTFATDDDSQESTTLQKAMKPLPNTQPDSQDHQQVSPEINSTAINPPLIRRPMQHSADDLIAGFSFGKPKDIKSGQFSGKQTKTVDKFAETPFKPRSAQSNSEDLNAGFTYGRPNPTQSGQYSGKQAKTIGPIMEAPVDNHIVYWPTIDSSHRAAVLPDHSSDRMQQKQHTDGSSPEQDAQSQAPHPAKTMQRDASPAQVPAPTDFPGVYNTRDQQYSRNRYQNVQDVLAQPQEPVLRRNSAFRFRDFQPRYRNEKPKKVLPRVNAFENPRFSATEPQSEAEPGHCRDAAVNHNQQRLSVSPQTTCIPEKKSRTSLQNDISVSSTGPPRQMPTSPPVSLVNRPMRDVNHRPSKMTTPTDRPHSSCSIRQSHIVRSNNKVKRSAPSQASSLRASSSSAHRRSYTAETPSTSRHFLLSPQNVLKKQFATKFHSVTADISGVLNNSLGTLMEEADEHLATISDLENRLEKQMGKVTRYKEQIQGKDVELQLLEGERGQLLSVVQDKDQELEKTSAKISKLSEKCNQYKQYLNLAIAEQQDLYKATKAKCDGAVAQMRVEEDKRKALQEQERKHAETIRESLSQLVKSTVNDYKQKECEFHEKVEALSQKVRERDQDVLQEREMAHALIQQNGNVRSIQETLKAFGAQIENVVCKVDAVVAGQQRQDDQMLKDTNTKLDRIMEYIRVLGDRTLPSAEITAEMQEMNAHTVSSILEKLEPIITAQTEIRASLDALTSEITRSVDDLWHELEDRQNLIEEYCHQRLIDREERIGVLQEHVDEIEEELANQNQLFFNSEQTLRKREAAIDTLEAEIQALTETQDHTTVQSEQLEQLRKECIELKNASAAQGSLVSELQSQLQESTTKLATEEQRHQEHVEELRKVLEQQVTEAKTAQVQAVEAAQQEAMIRMNAIKADIEARLNRASEERAALRLELDAAKSKIIQNKTESDKVTEQATSLDKELQSFRAEAANDREQANLEQVEQQAAQEQQLTLIDGLKSQLVRAEARFSNLVENAKSYDKAAQTVVFSLRQWTENYATIQAMARDLQKNKATNGVLNDLDARFKPLVEMQLLHTAVSRYCQSQKEAAQMLAGRTTVQARPQLFPSAEMAAGSVLARIPRVTIMSPAANAPPPKPPTVQIEQERRREWEQPKSILKASGYAWDNCIEEPRRELLSDNTSMNRGPYNRLVAGGAGTPGPATNTVESQKRKQSPGQEFGRKRVRAPKTGSRSDFSSPPEQDARSDLEHAPLAPRKAGPPRPASMIRENAVNDEQRMSPVSSSQSSPDQLGDNSTLFNRQRSQKSGRDPISVFMQRRRSARAGDESQQPQKESQQYQLGSQDVDTHNPHERQLGVDESQESHTHSQDVENRDHFALGSMLSRFTFRP